jgi:hypothetical protein
LCCYFSHRGGQGEFFVFVVGTLVGLDWISFLGFSFPSFGWICSSFERERRREGKRREKRRREERREEKRRFREEKIPRREKKRREEKRREEKRRERD